MLDSRYIPQQVWFHRRMVGRRWSHVEFLWDSIARLTIRILCYQFAIVYFKARACKKLLTRHKTWLRWHWPMMNSSDRLYIYCSWRNKQKQIETRRQPPPSPQPPQAQQSQKHSTSSFCGDSMSDVFANLLTRGSAGSSAADCSRSPRSPSMTRSPTGSKVSSRRESFLFFMGISTDSGECKCRFPLILGRIMHTP